MSALDSAGDYVLRPHLERRLATLVEAQRSSEAQRFWKGQIEPWTQKKEIASEEIPAVRGILKRYRSEFGDTSFFKISLKQLSALAGTRSQGQAMRLA